MKRESLIAYTANFVSFLLDNKTAKYIDRIVLFGSVARGNFDEDSDIDVFIDSKADIEEDVKRVFSLFKMSEIQKKWEMKGLKNEISIKVGDLKKWDLRRDIITDGIILYGKYKEVPEKVEYYLLIKTSFKKFERGKTVKLWRKLYGYKQKVGKKTYQTKGLVEECYGRKIENCILVPVKNKGNIINFLNENNISYTLNEIWSDNIS